MRFRKKPVVIEAEQFFPDNDPWPEGVVRRPGAEIAGYEGQPGDLVPIIETLEGNHQVMPADWIITGVKGERYPCKPDIFALTYDEVDR